MDKLLNSLELAEILRVKPVTIRVWLSRGMHIPHIKIGHTVRFQEKSIREWLEAKEKAGRKRNFEL